MLCECGCGKETKNRFSRGHNAYKRFFSAETKIKKSISQKGRIFSEETKKKISDAHKGIESPMKGRCHTEETKRKISLSCMGNIPGNKGKHHSEETKRKISFAKAGKGIGRKHSEETRMKISKNNAHAMKGRCHTEEWKKEQSKKMKGRIFSYSHNKKISENKKEKWKDPLFANKMKSVFSMKGRKHSEKTKKRLSESGIKNWSDPTYRDSQIKKSMIGNQILPNRPETFLINLLNDLYPGEWKYVGDGQVIIAGKCPDFINVNGQKKIIELFGDYWHRNDNPQDRINIFRPFGYDTLVIWESELKNIEKVKFKICGFVKK